MFRPWLILTAILSIAPAFLLGKSLGHRHFLKELGSTTPTLTPSQPWRAFHEARLQVLEASPDQNSEKARILVLQRQGELAPHGSAALWLVLAGLQSEREDPEGAQQSLDRFAAQVPRELWIEHARQARRRNDDHAALILYDRFLRKWPEDPNCASILLSRAGMLSRDRQRIEEAAQLYREFFRRFPDSRRASDAGLGLGDCLVALGEGESAIEAYRKVVEREGNNPKGVIANLSWAWAEHRAGRSSIAVERLRLLLKNPDLPHRERIEQAVRRFTPKSHPGD